MEPIDIKGLDKAELIQALHAGTRAVGMGVLHDRGPITVEQARAVLGGEGPSGTNGPSPRDGVVHLDYVAGRPIKVTLKGDALIGAWLYDRDSPDGEGSCQRVVDSVRARSEKAA